jgi:hypothetical protein
MPSVFCRRLAPSPNTFALDGIYCLPPSTAKRCKTASRVGPKFQGQSGRPKRAGAVSIEPKVRPLLSGDGISPNNLTSMDPPALSRGFRMDQHV